MVLRYEDFCEEPIRWLKRIQEFIVLTQEFDPRIVMEDYGIHNVDCVRKKIDNLNYRSFERLSADEMRLIDDIAGPTMERFNYEPACATL
jgi:hypothetical protein